MRPADRIWESTSSAGPSGDPDAGACHVAVEFALTGKARTRLARDRVDVPEARVVPRAFVLGSGVAKPDNQSNVIAVFHK